MDYMEMKDSEESKDILKNVNWNKMYMLSDSKKIPGFNVEAHDGGYYIFNKYGELTLVDEVAYQTFNKNRQDIQFHLTTAQSVSVYWELTAMLRDLDKFAPTYLFIVTPGIIASEVHGTTKLYSFMIETVIPFDSFVDFFSSVLLDEYEKFVRAPGVLISNMVARDHFLNEYHFPMMRKNKTK